MASSICCKCTTPTFADDDLPAARRSSPWWRWRPVMRGQKNKPARRELHIVALCSAGFAICSARGLGDRACGTACASGITASEIAQAIGLRSKSQPAARVARSARGWSSLTTRFASRRLTAVCGLDSGAAVGDSQQLQVIRHELAAVRHVIGNEPRVAPIVAAVESLRADAVRTEALRLIASGYFDEARHRRETLSTCYAAVSCTASNETSRPASSSHSARRSAERLCRSVTTVARWNIGFSS